MPSVCQPQLVTLAHSSSTFCQLEYSLQALAMASTLRIKRALQLLHPSLQSAFESKSKNVSVILETWIPEPQFIHGSVARRLDDELVNPNFQMPENTQSGHQFSVGTITIPDLLPLNGINFPLAKQTIGKIYSGRLVMCKAAVGRSFCCSSMDDIGDLPDGYHSFFIDERLAQESPYSLSFCSEGSIPASVKYVIKDKQLILPLYIVDVEWDPQEEKRSRQTLSCDNCEKSEAILYCQADAAHLCAPCDKEIHASKLASRHSRGLHCVVNCRLHPERLAEFFCPTCHVVVCLSCKMIGHHSNSETVDHALVSVPEAYASVISASNSPDPVVEEGRKSVMKQLNRVQAKAEVILSNATQIREQLTKAYNIALAELDEQISKKLRVLRGDAFLFGRLLQAFARSTEFLRYLKSGRDAPLFLLSWHHYLQAKVSMSVIPAAHSSAVSKPTDSTLCPDTLLELTGYFSIGPANPLSISSTTLSSRVTASKSNHSVLPRKIIDHPSEGSMDKALFSHQ